MADLFASVDYFRGIIAGVLLVVLLEAGAIVYLLQRLSGHKRTSKKELSSLPLKPAVSSEFEDCEWFRAACEKYFECIKRSEPYRLYLQNKFQAKLAAKFANNSVISRVKVERVFLGDSAPVINRARLFQPDIATQQGVCFNFSFSGSCGVELQVYVGGDISFFVQVELVELSESPLWLVYPLENDPTCYKVCFGTSPKPQFRVQMPILGEGRIRQTVSKLLVAKCEQLFSDLWVYPSWRIFPLPLLASKNDSVASVPRRILTTSDRPQQRIEKTYKAVAKISKNLVASYKRRTSAPIDPLLTLDVVDVAVDKALDLRSIQTFELCNSLLQFARSILLSDGSQVVGIMHQEQVFDLKRFDGEASSWRSTKFRPGMLLQTLVRYRDRDLNGIKIQRGSFLLSASPDYCFEKLGEPKHLSAVNSSLYEFSTVVDTVSPNLTCHRISFSVQKFMQSNDGGLYGERKATVLCYTSVCDDDTYTVVYRSFGDIVAPESLEKTSSLPQTSGGPPVNFYFYALSIQPFKARHAGDVQKMTLVSVVSLLDPLLAPYQLSMNYMYLLKSSIERSYALDRPPPPLPPRPL